MMRKMLAVGFCVICLAVTGCRTTALVDPAPLSISANHSAREAIIRGMAARGWTIKEQSEGRIVAEIAVRAKHRAVVGISYDQSQINIKYIDSENLKYKKSASGKQTIHNNYVAWVENLRNDIARELSLQTASQQ